MNDQLAELASDLRGARASRDFARRRLEELEDALVGYFAGGYPRGSCPDRATAEARIAAAGDRALDRLPPQPGPRARSAL